MVMCMGSMGTITEHALAALALSMGPGALALTHG